MALSFAFFLVAALSVPGDAHCTSMPAATSTTLSFVPPINTFPKGARRRFPQQMTRNKNSAKTLSFQLALDNGSLNLNRESEEEEKEGGKSKSKRNESSKSKCTTSSPGKKGGGRAKGKDSISAGRTSDDNETFIQFSRAFQRHVVYRCRKSDNLDPRKRTVIQSFEFLDQAVKLHPNARVLAPADLPYPPPSCSLVYADENNDGDARPTISRGRPIDAELEEEECETTVAGMGLWTLCELEYPQGFDAGRGRSHDALRTLLALVSSQSSFDSAPRHFFRLDPRRLFARGVTPEIVTSNHARLAELLSRGREECIGGDADIVGLAMGPSDVRFVLRNFPQLCLYDCEELERLVEFLLRPLPPAGSFPSVMLVSERGGVGSDVDWPSLSGKGYGAGLTMEQATKAIRMMPELLALYYEDARKPSMVYLYNQMQTPVPPKLIEEANTELNLEGADPSDAYTFGYLRSLGVSWSQMRILQSSLPLWTTSNLEPGWELLQKGPVRSMLKRPALDYLRMRLQIGPSDIYRLLKTHTRLSTYDACTNIMPKLDNLQCKLKLSSAELKKLMMRMPSLMGMGMAAFQDRMDFFLNEADTPIDDLRVAVLKQPSLLQYSVDSSLRPKLDFFVDELGISESSFISKMIKTAPAIMGLSLTMNLRPKVASIMRLGALGPNEVGCIVSTSPQTLLLSQKSKIEPTLNFLAQTLMLREPRELGQLIMKAPHVMRQGLLTSLAKKIDMLTDSDARQSKEVAIAIIRKNPALLVASNAVLEDRIERCPEDVDIATWLLPSNKGRGRDIRQVATEVVCGDPILASPNNADSFGSLTKIYPSFEFAARELGTAESAIRKACEKRIPVQGNYLYYLADYPLKSPEPPKPEALGRKKIIPVSIFCSGGIYPRDSVSVARGQSRTGGLAIQLFTDSNLHDRAQFLQEYSIAAKSCFGIRFPIRKDDDGSKLLAVFPLVNPSRNRSELFACSGALKIAEEILKSKRNENETLYDVKVYTDANSYTWNLVKSKERLLELGSHLTSQDLDSMDFRTVNIDILHPLARAFSRLNGQMEPPGSPHEPFDNAKVQFVHSMDGVSLNQRGLGYVNSLKRQATSAAMWQFNRERNL